MTGNPPRTREAFEVMRYHPRQADLWVSEHRFNVVHAGRRSGKTEICGKRKLVMKALRGGPWPDWKGFAGAPTRDQAKRIYWDDLKRMVPYHLRLKAPSESHLILYLVNGSEIHVLGMDKPERVEGTPWDHGILDEYGNMKVETWPAHVRPALSDRHGTCDFIGVPEGRNHYYDLHVRAKLDRSGVWGNYHWLSSDILSADEIEQAKKDLDESTYEQEYEGSFVVFSGLIYYKWNPPSHLSACRQFYDPHAPLIFTFDFNVSPGTASIMQEMVDWPNDMPPIMGRTITSAIGEVHIPRNSNTEKVCDKLIQDWEDHEGKIFCYGDATGGAQGSAKVKGSDWDLIKAKLYPAFGNKLVFKVKKANPRERARVNAVNSRLMNMFGDVHFQVDGEHCPNIVKDFEGVRVLEGSAGEIDKNYSPDLTHLSDGIGYYIDKEFPILRPAVQQSKFWK